MRYRVPLFPLVGVAMVAQAGPARAVTDEIQVYDATIADEGQTEIALHNNFAALGRKTAEYPGGVVSNHALNGVPEFAYGVTQWFEAGLYLPDYTVTNQGRVEADAVKLRGLLVSPWAAGRTFFYGVNFEIGYNAHHWEPARWSGEVRPIVGVHLGDVDLIANPIIDSDYRGVGHLDFAPAERVAYHLSPIWALALEHYADFGRIDNWQAASGQAQTLFAVADYHREDSYSVEFGVGHGFTAASDDMIFKLIVSADF